MAKTKETPIERLLEGSDIGLRNVDIEKLKVEFKTLEEMSSWMQTHDSKSLSVIIPRPFEHLTIAESQNQYKLIIQRILTIFENDKKAKKEAKVKKDIPVPVSASDLPIQAVATAKAIQTDLEGKTLEVKEFEVIKESILYLASKYQVTVSQDEDFLDKFHAMKPEAKSLWVKSHMRVRSGADPQGKDFDLDFKSLYAAIF